MSKTNMEKQDLMDRAYQLGSDFEQTYAGCAQACFATLQVVLDKRDQETDAVFRATSSMAGGVAGMGDGCCGAYLGAAAFISYLTGRTRDRFAEPGQEALDATERSRRYGKLCGPSDDLVIELHKKFIGEYGTVTCHSIHRQLFGRPFFNKDSDEYQKFQEAGAYDDDGCPSVVGNTARWTTEILIDAGVVS